MMPTLNDTIDSGCWEDCPRKEQFQQMAKENTKMLRNKTGDYEIKTISVEETGLFYDTHMDAETGCIGHLRADFGRNGKEFWTTWFEHCGELKTQAFKDELDVVINHLRADGNMLNSLAALVEYCHRHQDARLTVKHRADTYIFKIDTEAHSYYLRGMLTQGDYNIYCYCFVRDRLEKYLTASRAEQHSGKE